MSFPFFATWYVDIPFESMYPYFVSCNEASRQLRKFCKYPRCERKRDGERGKIAFARPENESVVRGKGIWKFETRVKKHGALAITEGEKYSLIHGGTIRKLAFTQQLVSRDRK